MTHYDSPTVYCTVEDIELPGNGRRPTPSVKATCDACDHTTESYGRDNPSVLRCLALMREECPRGESNFYEEGDRIAMGPGSGRDVRSQTYANQTETGPPRILICTALADMGLEPEVSATLQRMLRGPAEIVPSSSIDWKLVRNNEGGWDATYRWITGRYDLFCLVGHSETGGLSKGVYTIAEQALKAGKKLVLWRAGEIYRVDAVHETWGDWKKDFGEAVLSGETASPPPVRIDPDDVPF